MSFQQIILHGNLTRDLEIRQVGEHSVAQTSLAVSEKFRKQDGTTGENTEFFELEIWDKTAVFQFLTKGVQILIVGKVRTEKWQDQNGQNRERKKVRVETIQLCGSKPQNSAPAPQAPQPPQGYAPQYAPQPQYQQPAYPQPPAQPQRPVAPQPPVAPNAPMPPQPGQPGNQQYPPMNPPQYTGYDPNDLPPDF